MKIQPSLKHVTRFAYGDALAQEIRVDGEVPVFGSNGIVGTHNDANMEAPAIVIGRKGSYGKVTWSDVGGFCIDTAFFIDKRSTSANLRWLFWTLQTLGLDENSEDTGVPGLSRERAYQSKLLFPSELDQQRIADFLDDKTARIDALIAEKEKLLATLVEWRAAELTRICFGEARAMVSTGNPWIREVPKGWRVVRLKHLVSGIEQGWSPECEAGLAAEDEWGVLKAGAANAGVYREDEHKALPASLEPIPGLEVHAGDVLITRASGTADYVGSFAYVYATRPKLMLSDKNFRLKFDPEPQLLPELLAWMCNTRVLREQILQLVSGADGLAKNIGSGNLKELWLAVPPLKEQSNLIGELHASRSKLDGLSEHVAAHITHLREYRSSLISAAVTGQLDVCTLKAGV